MQTKIFNLTGLGTLMVTVLLFLYVHDDYNSLLQAFQSTVRSESDSGKKGKRPLTEALKMLDNYLILSFSQIAGKSGRWKVAHFEWRSRGLVFDHDWAL